jgi:hypothetical protein
VHFSLVDPSLRVIDLDAVAECSLQADTVRSLKPPCSSYEVVITASASRRARSDSCAPTASASGVDS